MALESIPEVRQHILEVMSEAVGKFFLDFIHKLLNNSLRKHLRAADLRRDPLAQFLLRHGPAGHEITPPHGLVRNDCRLPAA